MTWQRLRVPLVFCLVLFGLGALAVGLLGRPPADSIDGALARGLTIPAPELALPVIEPGEPGPRLARSLRGMPEGSFDLAALEGTPAVVNFWASWCVPCLFEAPVLEEAWPGLRRDGVLLVGVSTQDTPHAAGRFLDYFHSTYPNLVDDDDVAVGPWSLGRLPQTFFVTADGEIAARVTGSISPGLIEQGARAARTGRPLAPVKGESKE